MAEERILVVDDEYLIRWTLQQNLQKEGYEVLIAETGEEALEKVEGRHRISCFWTSNCPGWTVMKSSRRPSR